MQGALDGSLEDRWYIAHHEWDTELMEGAIGILPAPQRSFGRKKNKKRGHRITDLSWVLFTVKRAPVHSLLLDFKPPHFEDIFLEEKQRTLYINECKPVPPNYSQQARTLRKNEIELLMFKTPPRLPSPGPSQPLLHPTSGSRLLLIPDSPCLPYSTETLSSILPLGTRGEARDPPTFDAETAHPRQAAKATGFNDGGEIDEVIGWPQVTAFETQPVEAEHSDSASIPPEIVLGGWKWDNLLIGECHYVTLEELDSALLFPNLLQAQIDVEAQIQTAFFEEPEIDEIVAVAKAGTYWSWALVARNRERKCKRGKAVILEPSFIRAGHFLSEQSLLEKKKVRAEIFRLAGQKDPRLSAKGQ
jgi:hypothetical protein